MYPSAIEVGTGRSRAKGLGVFGGVLALSFSLWFLYITVILVEDLIQRPILGGWVVASLFFMSTGFVISILTAIYFFRVDTLAFRDEPVLFNRATRKLHVFRHRTKFTQPFSVWPLTVDTYDWDCAHGEIHGGVILRGGSVPSTQYSLLIAITKSPGSHELIDVFRIGPDSTGVDYLSPLWEHVRRYMEEGGPPLQPNDNLASLRHFSNREILVDNGLRFAKPNLFKAWSASPVPETFWNLIFLVLSPILVPNALFAWIAHATSRDPWWPDDVLAEAGGAPLPENDVLAKWTEPKPPAAPANDAWVDDEADPVQQRKDWWKFVLAIVAVTLLIIGAKFGQQWWRGF